MSLNERILADLRRTYLSAVQEMALSPEDSNGHRRGESLAASTSHTVFSIFGAVRGPVYGRTCEGCEHVIAEKWVKGKTAHRCNAPGPCRGYVVGQEHFIPYIPAWCPELINKKEGSTK